MAINYEEIMSLEEKNLELSYSQRAVSYTHLTLPTILLV